LEGLGFGRLFLFKLLPGTGRPPPAISVKAAASPDTIAMTYSAGILHPQLHPQPISADFAPPDAVVVTVSTVTLPSVTVTVEVVGGGVVVCTVHSLQVSQDFTRPSLLTPVAHHGEPSKSAQPWWSLGGEDISLQVC